MKIIYMFVAVVFVLFGAYMVNTQVQSQITEQPEGSSFALEGLALGAEGQKWMMDDHTRSSFSEMAEGFLPIDSAQLDEVALKDLGSNLRGQIDSLILNCSMDGEPHDQLHVFLMSYIDAVEGLSRSGDLEDADQVRAHLEGYTHYFE